MPGPTATPGVVGVRCSLATDRTTAIAVRSAGGGFVPNPPYQRGKEGETTTVVKPSGGCRGSGGNPE